MFHYFCFIEFYSTMIQQFVNPFLCWWTLGFFYHLDLSWLKFIYTIFVYKTHMISFVITWKLNCWVIWWLFVYEKLKNNFPSDWIILHAHVQEELRFPVFFTVGGGKWKAMTVSWPRLVYSFSQQCLWWEEIFNFGEAEIITFFLS